MKTGCWITVCIPSYNSSRTIERAVESVIGQSRSASEVIIVDDCSADGTWEVIEKLTAKYSQIRAYRNERNRGLARNWNRCIELSHGRYISILHADDYYSPLMLERQIATFETYPEIGIAFTLAYLVDEDGQIRSSTVLPAELDRSARVYDLPDILYALMRNRNSFLTCDSAMLRRDFVVQAGLFSDEYPQSLDLHLWFRTMKIAPVAILPERLINYRVWRAQATQRYHHQRTSPHDFFGLMKRWVEVERDRIERRFGMEAFRQASYRLKSFEVVDLLFTSGNAVLNGQKKLATAYLGEASDMVAQMRDIEVGIRWRVRFFGLLDRLRLFGPYCLWRSYRRR